MLREYIILYLTLGSHRTFVLVTCTHVRLAPAKWIKFVRSDQQTIGRAYDERGFGTFVHNYSVLELILLSEFQGSNQFPEDHKGRTHAIPIRPPPSVLRRVLPQKREKWRRLPRDICMGFTVVAERRRCASTTANQHGVCLAHSESRTHSQPTNTVPTNSMYIQMQQSAL